jgi:hypothetical protein
MASPTDNPQEFLKDCDEVIQFIRDNGIRNADPLVKKFKAKYGEPATVAPGLKCSACASCAGCAVCGVHVIEAIQVGHTLQAFGS